MDFSGPHPTAPLTPLQQSPLQYAQHTLQNLQDNDASTNISTLYVTTRTLNHATYIVLVDLSAKKRREAVNVRKNSLKRITESGELAIKHAMMKAQSGEPSTAIAPLMDMIQALLEHGREEEVSIRVEETEIYDTIAANSRELFADPEINFLFHALSELDFGHHSNNEDEQEQYRREQLRLIAMGINHFTSEMMAAMEAEMSAFKQNLGKLLFDYHMKFYNMGLEKPGIRLDEDLTQAASDLGNLLLHEYGISFLDCSKNEECLPQIARFWRNWSGLVRELKVDFISVWEFVAERPFRME
ncbi:MAG: hypothetical protein Q9164_006596 [Protoblastenia rupestris]